MKIERIDVLPVRLPMKAVLTLPRGPSRTLAEGKRIALVRITDRDGHVGWGEAGPSRRWSAETLESCASSIREYLAPALIGHDADNPIPRRPIIRVIVPREPPADRILVR